MDRNMTREQCLDEIAITNAATDLLRDSMLLNYPEKIPMDRFLQVQNEIYQKMLPMRDEVLKVQRRLRNKGFDVKINMQDYHLSLE